MLISIITVSFNSDSFILSCINSIKNQKYELIEHIIVDGGSTDNTLKIVNQNKLDNQIIISEPDYGIYDAMNKGLAKASGDVIGFLNSDDFFSNDWVVGEIVDLFKSDKSLEACYSDLIYVYRKKTNKKVRYWKSYDFTKGLFEKGWCPPHPTFFVKKSIYDKFGAFNLKYKLAADFELMFRFNEIHKIKTAYVPKVWVKMRLGGVTNQSLKNIISQNIEIFKILKNRGVKPNIFLFTLSKFFIKLKQFLVRN